MTVQLGETKHGVHAARRERFLIGNDVTTTVTRHLQLTAAEHERERSAVSVVVGTEPHLTDVVNSVVNSVVDSVDDVAVAVAVAVFAVLVVVLVKDVADADCGGYENLDLDDCESVPACCGDVYVLEDAMVVACSESRKQMFSRRGNDRMQRGRARDQHATRRWEKYVHWHAKRG